MTLLSRDEAREQQVGPWTYAVYMALFQFWLLLLSCTHTDVDGTPNLYNAVNDEKVTFTSQSQSINTIFEFFKIFV